jgi:predicted Zn-dependent peptidase
MRRREFLATGAGLAAWAARPVAVRAQSPPAGQGVTRTRLPNGFTLLVRENPTAPVVAMSLITRAGTRWETRRDAGIVNLVQLMIVRGTEKMDGGQIVEAADRMGGSIDAYGDADYAEIPATALDRYTADILDLVADVALTPTIPQATMSAVRDFILNQIRNRGDKPYDVAADTMLARLFGEHGYAWSPSGRRDAVERMDRNALIDEYRRFYVPGELVLGVSGRVRASEVLDQVQKRFGGMAPGTRPPVPQVTLPPMAASREVLEVPGAQAQILSGGPAPSMTEPDHAAVKVLGAILGGGLAARFFSELRDKEGLAYTTGLLYPARVDRSYVLAQLGTAPENVERAEAALGEQLARIQREPATAEEIRVAKAYILGNLAMDRRTNARQAWYLAAYEAAGVGQEYLDKYSADIRNVTAADVQRVARTYLATLRTVIVRPPKP